MPEILPHILNPSRMNGLHGDRVLQCVRMTEVSRNPRLSSMTFNDSSKLPPSDRKQSLISCHISREIKHCFSFIEERVFVRNKRLHST